MIKNIFITGGNGLLVLNWATVERGASTLVLGIHERIIQLKDVSEYNFTMFINTLAHYFKTNRFDLVIHAAGNNTVEACEANPDVAKYTNVRQ